MAQDGSLSVVLCWFLIGTLIMLFVYSANPALDRESFTDFITNQGYPTSQACKAPLTTPLPELSGPGDATLESPRTPYHLLGDHLKSGPERISTLKSECAYEVDMQSRIAKTGSYGQVTNNYKHKMPDNNTTWLRELALSFYENKY